MDVIYKRFQTKGVTTMCEIDEQHELMMRAKDEMRELTDEEIAKQGDIYYEYKRDHVKSK